MAGEGSIDLVRQRLDEDLLSYLKDRVAEKTPRPPPDLVGGFYIAV
jgi:hypothetical protein